MSNGKRAALYLRVSTDKQTTENQRLEVERIADRICIIDRGEIVKKGHIDDLLSKSDANSLNELFLSAVGDHT